MTNILLTANDAFLIGPISKVLGWIMDGIFNLLDLLNIPNIGLAIILFTIVVYILMLPLTIKQQKFSKLNAKMAPELQAIRDKYQNKKDNDSVMQMNAETQEVYAKYGVSPTGSCVQLLIQMPILLALYQVIYRIPAYVGKIGDAFGLLADKVIEKNLVETVKGFKEAAAYTKNFGINEKNAVIDVLNKMNSTDLINFANENGFANIVNEEGHFILSQLDANGEVVTKGLLDIYNNFLGLNIANSPSSLVSTAFATGAFGLAIAALAIPVLSAVTQWINVKLMPQQETDKNRKKSEMEDTMASSMKTMNMFMPIMSAFFCYSLPAGMGLYWVAGSVVRSIQQVIINKHIDKMDLQKVIEQNKAKSEKKMAKYKESQAKLQEYANMKTKSLNGTSNTYTEKAKQVTDTTSKESTSYTSTSNAKPGSLMAKANLVKEYNERNNKK